MMDDSKHTYPSDVAFTPAVKATQDRLGSRGAYARMEQKRGWATEVSDKLAGFIAERDSFYLATASADGQPYIQHRGGPKGFLKTVDKNTLAFADFAGNQQYISIGNLSENDKVTLFLMDYPNRQRVKIWGTAKVVEGDEELNRQLAHPSYPAKVERAIVIAVSAWDINCPQHIKPRYTRDQRDEEIQRLQARIQELEEALKEQA